MLTQHSLAVTGLLLALALTLVSIACGWYLLWRLELHQYRFFRDLLGMNSGDKERKRQRAHVQIRSIKQAQLNSPRSTPRE